MPGFYEDEVFDVRSDWGFESVPIFNVTISRFMSGFERRNRNWQRPVHRLNITIGADGGRLDEDVQEVQEWFMAMGGPEVGFRTRDWTDYKSCKVNLVPTPIDMPTVELTPTTFQLVKTYTKGPNVQIREIYKPENTGESPLMISVGGVEETTGFSFDETTGIITFSGPPGGSVKWGGTFFLPVRFESQGLVKSAVVFQHQSAVFSLLELRVQEPA